MKGNLIQMKTVGNLLMYNVFLVLIFAVGAAAAEDVELIVGEWPPYIEEAAENKGFMSEIVIRAFAKEGIQASLTFKPWKRVEVETGTKGSISFGWYYTEERAEEWHFSDEIIRGEIVFLTRKDNNIKWNQLEDLKPYEIGITRSYSYGDDFDRLKPRLKIQEANADENNIRKILGKRMDLFPVDPMVFARILRTRFAPEEREQFKLHTDKPLSSMGVHLVCAIHSEKGKSLVERFNKGLKAVTEDGTKAKIMEKVMAVE